MTPAQLRSTFVAPFEALLALRDRLSDLFPNRRRAHRRTARLAVEEMEDRVVPALAVLATLSPPNSTVGSPVVITGSVSADQPMTNVQVTFAWGDGFTSTANYSGAPTTLVAVSSPAHAYSVPGSYPVTTTVTATYSGMSGGSGGSGGPIPTETTSTMTIETVNPGSGGSGGGPPGSSGGSGGPLPNVWVGSTPSVPEGGSGGIWVYRDGNTSQPLTVNLSFGPDDQSHPLAAWGADYTATASGGGSAALSSGGGTVSFAAGAPAVFLSLSALTDALIEGPEGFRTTVLAGAGYNVGLPTAVNVLLTDTTNHPPVVENFDAGSVVHGKKITINLGAHASDQDPGDTLTISIVTQPNKGTLVATQTPGVWEYTADPTYLGAVTFTYRANDGTANSNNGTVTITATNNDPGPLTNSDLLSEPGVYEGANGGTYVGVTAQAIDPDGDTVTYEVWDQDGFFQIVASGQNAGQITVKAGARIDYETSDGFCTIWVKASDSLGGFVVDYIDIPIFNVAPSKPTDTDNRLNRVAGFAEAGTSAKITAHSTDPGDAPNASCVRYSLDPNGNPGNMFEIDPVSGEVTVRDGASLGFAVPYYTITVVASDGNLTRSENFKIYPFLYWSDDAPDWSSVSQDDFADCWLIATIVSIAYDDPDWLDSLIATDPNDPLKFTVTLFNPDDNEWQDVEVDFNNDPYWEWYSEADGIWLAVLEKAFWNIGVELDFNMPQAAIPYLTGWSSSVSFIWGWDPVDGAYRTDWTDNAIYNFLDAARNNNDPADNSPVIAGSVHLDEFGEWYAWAMYGIYPHHAYTVGDVWTDNDGSWVTIRDPYGYRSPTLGESNGVVTLPFDDFVLIFTELGYASWLDGPGGNTGFDGMLDGMSQVTAARAPGATTGITVPAGAPSAFVGASANVIRDLSVVPGAGPTGAPGAVFAPPIIGLSLAGTSSNTSEVAAPSSFVEPLSGPGAQRAGSAPGSSATTEPAALAVPSVRSGAEADNLDEVLMRYAIALPGPLTGRAF